MCAHQHSPSRLNWNRSLPSTAGHGRWGCRHWRVTGERYRRQWQYPPTTCTVYCRFPVCTFNRTAPRLNRELGVFLTYKISVLIVCEKVPLSNAILRSCQRIATSGQKYQMVVERLTGMSKSCVFLIQRTNGEDAEEEDDEQDGDVLVVATKIITVSDAAATWWRRPISSNCYKYWFIQLHTRDECWPWWW